MPCNSCLPQSTAPQLQLMFAPSCCREHVGDTRLLRRRDVWGALLAVGMPLTALTRNLGCLTSLGAFDPDRCRQAAEHLAAVTARFQDEGALKAGAGCSCPLFLCAVRSAIASECRTCATPELLSVTVQ